MGEEDGGPSERGCGPGDDDGPGDEGKEVNGGGVPAGGGWVVIVVADNGGDRSPCGNMSSSTVADGADTCKFLKGKHNSLNITLRDI